MASRASDDSALERQLASGLAEMSLPIDAQAVAQLCSYAQLVLKWNKTFNLVSRQDVGRFVNRHLLDSLSAYPWLAPPNPEAAAELPIADVGSGAGLPGIPLAISMPQRQWVLLERSDKKIRFLKQALRHLALANVTLVGGDAADYVAEERGTFAAVVSRAVMPPDALWALASPLLAPSGRMVLHAATTSLGEADDQGWDFGELVQTERHPVQVPGLQSTHQLLIIKKAMS